MPKAEARRQIIVVLGSTMRTRWRVALLPEPGTPAIAPPTVSRHALVRARCEPTGCAFRLALPPDG
ncbi:MAG: hypothetical protein BGO20_18350 [Bosea sp. 67-29]|nr:MAG: hypothetical protein BGO20_18350 [Bosea sp. 67-29]